MQLRHPGIVLVAVLVSGCEDELARIGDEPGVVPESGAEGEGENPGQEGEGEGEGGTTDDGSCPDNALHESGRCLLDSFPCSGLRRGDDICVQDPEDPNSALCCLPHRPMLEGFACPVVIGGEDYKECWVGCGGPDFVPTERGPGWCREGVGEPEPVCTFGQDQTCNDSPLVSSLWGRCEEDGTCTCFEGLEVNPETGRCRPAGNEGEGEPPGIPACLPLPHVGANEPRTVIRIPERSAYDPDVLVAEGKFVAYLNSTIWGDGGVYRSDSADGLAWSEPVRITDGASPWSHHIGGEPFVLKTQAGYVMWHTTPWDGAAGVSPRTKIGRSTSADGLAWTTTGVVFEGSDDRGADGLGWDTGEIHRPKVWYDGALYHLYYDGSADRFYDGDMGYSVGSIGHATSMDGRRFVFDSWVFASEECQEGPPYSSSFSLDGVGRPPCESCRPAEVVLFVSMQRCHPSPSGLYMLRSDDGWDFEESVPVDHSHFQGTVLAGDDGAVLYHGHYSEGSVVELEALDPAPPPPACR